MKVYSIGREQGCDIIIDDRTDVVSRRHATLTVNSNSNMTITDLSGNGTYVNGIRISKNVPVPITRKDTISFAHVAVLDWNRVPAEASSKGILLTLLAILLFAGAGVGAYFLWFADDNKDDKHGFANTEISTQDQTPQVNNAATQETPEEKAEDKQTETKPETKPTTTNNPNNGTNTNRVNGGNGNKVNGGNTNNKKTPEKKPEEKKEEPKRPTIVG